MIIQVRLSCFHFQLCFLEAYFHSNCATTCYKNFCSYLVNPMSFPLLFELDRQRNLLLPSISFFFPSYCTLSSVWFPYFLQIYFLLQLCICALGSLWSSQLVGWDGYALLSFLIDQLGWRQANFLA